MFIADVQEERESVFESFQTPTSQTGPTKFRRICDQSFSAICVCLRPAFQGTNRTFSHLQTVCLSFMTENLASKQAASNGIRSRSHLPAKNCMRHWMAGRRLPSNNLRRLGCLKAMHLSVVARLPVLLCPLRLSPRSKTPGCTDSGAQMWLNWQTAALSCQSHRSGQHLSLGSSPSHHSYIVTA